MKKLSKSFLNSFKAPTLIFKGEGWTKGNDFPNGFQPSQGFRKEMERGNIKR